MKQTKIMDKKYKTRRELPGLGEGCILTKFNNRWYHDKWDRIRLPLTKIVR